MKRKLSLRIEGGASALFVEASRLLIEQPDDCVDQLEALLDGKLVWDGPALLSRILEQLDGIIIHAVVQMLVQAAPFIVARLLDRLSALTGITISLDDLSGGS